VKQQHKLLHRYILEAIEAQTLVTEKVDLYKMDMKTSQALDQLRQANYVKGIFHDIIHGPIMIEGMPIITIEGQKYLDKLRNFPSPTPDSKQKKVFIVHGRNEQLKDAAENLVRSLGLEPIILHKQPNQGRTIIEKFSDYAQDAGFAIVLLSSDDEGRLRQNPLAELRPRARQNVIF
jgi:hypothetical protein